MDFWSAPWYLLLRSAGAVPHNPNAGRPYPEAMLGVPLRALWQVGLWAVVLPAILLLVLLRRTVERLEPGLGTAAAVILGLATLMLPFSTMLFAHVPAALLAFLSFALLFGRDAGPLRIAAAGAAARPRRLDGRSARGARGAARPLRRVARAAFSAAGRVRRRGHRRTDPTARVRLVGLRLAVPPRVRRCGDQPRRRRRRAGDGRPGLLRAPAFRACASGRSCC